MKGMYLGGCERKQNPRFTPMIIDEKEIKEREIDIWKDKRLFSLRVVSFDSRPLLFYFLCQFNSSH